MDLDDRPVKTHDVARRRGFKPKCRQCEAIVEALGDRYADPDAVEAECRRLRVPFSSELAEAAKAA